MNAELILKWLLILSGLVLMFAFAAVFLPVSWMAQSSEWLELGTFPNRPLTIYLARSTSLLYGVHGVMMFYTALTLDKHWRLVWLFGWLHIVIGCTILVVDILAPMPSYWIAIEGGPVALLGVVILMLAGQAFGSRSGESEKPGNWLDGDNR